MSPIPFSLGALAPKAHRLVLSALLGASVIALPLGALAQTAPAPHHHAAAKMKRETVEQRISMLHTALKITPGEEANWTPVAQAMRDNEAAMQKLVAERTAQSPHSISAVDDLRTYERFTQAHVSGLKNLISSFETLYHAMPEPQKAVADQVFRKYGARGPLHAS
jgi:protein CpxP